HTSSGFSAATARMRARSFAPSVTTAVIRVAAPAWRSLSAVSRAASSNGLSLKLIKALATTEWPTTSRQSPEAGGDRGLRGSATPARTTRTCMACPLCLLRERAARGDPAEDGGLAQRRAGDVGRAVQAAHHFAGRIQAADGLAEHIQDLHVGADAHA